MNAWVDAWSTALDDLELDLADTQALITALHNGKPHADVAATRPWRPPTGLGPLPESLVERARVVLERQLRVSQQLASAVAVNRRHSRAAAAIRSAETAVPIYVDLAI